MVMMFKLAVVGFVLGVFLGVCAQTPGGDAAQSPVQLPGRGLAQHDFMYAGESHDRRIFIVRQGKIVWSYDDPAGKGEISDAVMLSNGNILFAHQYGVTEITPEKKVCGTMSLLRAMRCIRRCRSGRSTCCLSRTAIRRCFAW